MRCSKQCFFSTPHRTCTARFTDSKKKGGVQLAKLSEPLAIPHSGNIEIFRFQDPMTQCQSGANASSCVRKV